MNVVHMADPPEPKHSLTFAREIVQFIAGGLVIAGTLCTLLVYWTGGVKFVNQVASDNVANKVDQIQVSIDGMRNQINGMPRTTDFLALGARMDHFEAALAALSEQQRRDEIMLSNLSGVIESLSRGTAAPVRQSR